MSAVEKKLTEMKIEYVKARVEEGGVYVDQLFFHDPDGLMIEICNCDNIPVVPLAGESLRMCSLVSCSVQQKQLLETISALHIEEWRWPFLALTFLSGSLLAIKQSSIGIMY